LDPSFVFVFYAVHSLDRVRVRLSVNQLMMNIAQQHEVFRAISVRERKLRLTARAINTLTDDVSQLAQYYQIVAVEAGNSKFAPTRGEGATSTWEGKHLALLCDRNRHDAAVSVGLRSAVQHDVTTEREDQALF
jgi:hypothetical protein